ncbi:hypothetical protein Y1Q_0002355 [Alligator mississippiensis]|uniref:Uncharacterized protein n=1 Tax=Alligator mississippiensis TaxID=8496 RepID=A0A151MGV0_ALLMI|nr:hypothetical protein Y1Q_0002355 [Alligator mississippiensis]
MSSFQFDRFCTGDSWSSAQLQSTVRSFPSYNKNINRIPLPLLSVPQPMVPTRRASLGTIGIINNSFANVGFLTFKWTTS